MVERGRRFETQPRRRRCVLCRSLSLFRSFSEFGSRVLLGVERRNPLCLFRGAGGGLPGRRPQFRLSYCARNRTDSRCPAFRISDRRNSFGAPTRERFDHLLWLVHTRPERPGWRRYSGVFAILVSATIAGYSLTDGIGVHVAQNPWSHIPWLIFVQAIPFLTFVIWRRRTI